MILIKSKKKNLINIYINKSYNKVNKLLIKKKYLVVFDYNIFFLFFNLIKKEFNNFLYFILPFGENIKNINSLKIIWKYLIINSVNKNFLLIIIGGGVLGDIFGYICSSYFRGINYILLPTTLLSQVDSSIGGKNAVNFYSKNALGSISYPIFIYINYIILFYMKKKEFKDGYSEIIKYSLINSKKFFYYLLKNKRIKKIIIRSCYIKSKIISQDYYELNYRSVLNLGHTYAHSIENNKIHNYSHGISVSIGIIFSLFISSFFYKFSIFELKKIIKLFNLYKFFVKNKLKFTIKMIKKLILDKKFDNKINYILIKKIGSCIKKTLKKPILINFIKKYYEI
ncbi:3-dehydroquinate synthase [Candidatus Carsonella ruddii]|uniref:3-dehydroquinate synthase n=1 Tax=Candidatus Carsonella ruddii (Diaphorina cf. continua) TaxID=2661587 RepID=A0A7R7ABH8_CARRU|nr:3-dehydroquinate synthase family protein [Candidatus Carsonella ruddii (Diaphorina cf. continua)]BCG49246.1 3-dehydroquinate synthase [Candidatus Carsonella ruddii (Diaphorina cf. continua)]